jgi:hypothetical protein
LGATVGERPTLYSWSFRAGREILERLEATYGKDRAEKRFQTITLSLRSELLPSKFKRELVNYFIEIVPEIALREEIKEERVWRVDEFYRYSTAILAGFYDALQAWKKDKGAMRGGGDA